MSWRNNKLKIFVFVLILVFYGSLLIHKISFHTDDLGRHFQNGKMVLEREFDVLKANFYSYTEPDRATINDHWLAGIIFYLLYSAFGFNGLIIFTAILLLLAFALIFWRATERADFWLVAALSVPAILILRERTDVRPEIFSYALAAIFIYFLFGLMRHPEQRRVFALIPLQLLWVNLHTFFFVGPMLTAGFLTEQVFQNYKDFIGNRLVRKFAVLFGGLIAVSFINPNGVAGVLRPLYRLADYPVIRVTEDQLLFRILGTKPVEDISVLIFFSLALVLLAGLCAGWIQRRKPIFYSLAGVGTAMAGLAMIRTLPFFGIIFLLATASNFNESFVRMREWIWRNYPKTRHYTGAVLATILLLVLACLLLLGIFGKISKYNKFGLGVVSRSNEAARFFLENGLRGPIFNDPAIGSLLIWHLFPRERVFLDNRHADAYSKEFIHQYEEEVTDEKKWHEALARYGFNAIVFFHYDEIFNARQFLARRMRDPDWAVVYADNNAVILLHNNDENKEKIGKFQITKENVGEKMRYLLESRDVDDHIAAADIFNLIDRGDLALSVYQEVVLKQPKNSKIWRIMGETAVLRNNEKSDILAVIYLERAIDFGQKNAGAYTRLGLAYFRLGRFKEAEKTLQKALELDQNREDAKEYWQKLQPYLKERKR